jgi:hypothetical protein
MTRQDLSPQNYFATLLKQVESDILDVKSKQLHSGESGLIGYFAKSDNQWDSTGSINTGNPSVGQSATFEVTFTSSGAQDYPIEDIFSDIFFGGTAESNRPTEQPNGFWAWTDGTNYVGLDTPRADFVKSYGSSKNQYKWIVGITVYGQASWFMKFYCGGSSKGTIAVVRTF